MCYGDSRSYLVALDRGTTGASGATALGAVARDVAGLVAPVAGLGVPGTLGAVTALQNCESSSIPNQRVTNSTYSCGPRLRGRRS